MRLLKSDDYKNFKSILIYATYKYVTELIAKYLWDHGIEAKAYNAGMTEKEREFTQSQFLMNKTKVLVCTIAFGMGIDK